MSQNVVIFSDDPSGVELLDNKLTPMKQNILSNNSGTSRPSYAIAHTIWTNTTTTPWVVYYYDGADDIAIGTVNASTNTYTPAGLRLDNVTATTNPTVNEDSADGYSVGSIWVNTSTDKAYIMCDSAVGAAVWRPIYISSDFGSLAFLSSVANSNMATMAANTVKMNNTGASATPSDVALSASQLIGRGATGNAGVVTLGSGLAFTGTALDNVFASQADMEAATNTTNTVTPSMVKFHPGVSKAWVRFNGTGTIAINGSYNVTSLTDNGTGTYSVNLTTAFSSSTGNAVTCASDQPAGSNTPSWGTASRIDVQTYNNANAAVDPSTVYAVAFGDQ